MQPLSHASMASWSASHGGDGAWAGSPSDGTHSGTDAATSFSTCS